MLELNYCEGSVLVFNVDDWVVLRKIHRILGTLVGDTYVVQTLPLKLLPEEVLLLIDKGLAKVIDRKYDNQSKEDFVTFENDLFAEQKVIYTNNRKRQLESMIDDIVAAKRRHGDQRSSDDIFNDELKKSCNITKENMIWPILLTPLQAGDCVEISRDTISPTSSDNKYAIYKDLWERGYYITSGHKFGADFLVYLGDPVSYHAIFIIHCVEDPDQSISPSEIVAYGRLANSVKKRAVLASLKEGKVSYITINWIDAQ